uniref:Uncharacterized protein n=1 Tax=Solanum tuberosum TaxID=4113 RepID=M1D975_SOLTU
MLVGRRSHQRLGKGGLNPRTQTIDHGLAYEPWKQSKDTNLQKGTKRAERRKKRELGDHQVHLASRRMTITSPKVPVCQALKDKIKLARERSSQRIAKWFRDAVLDCPKLQTLRMLKAKARKRWNRSKGGSPS